MIDHVGINVTDLAVARRFYTTLLGEPESDGTYVEWENLALAEATAERPVTRGLHVGLVAPSPEEVDRRWRRAVDAGFAPDGEPGPRPQYAPDYYGGFLLDPDGNSIEPCHMESAARTGVVDHVWLRVADVAATRDAYLAIAEPAGIELVRDTPPGRVRFRTANLDSVAFVSDDRPLTENVHIAFASPRPGAVEAFHAAALAAGWRDNGAPGERPEYHPGYHAAFALDPNGFNVEVVDHQR